MSSTFVNPRVNSAVNLGIQSWDETEPMRLWQNASASEIEVVIRATYRQVLGNAHVMESERLTVAESQLKRGDISVREFVRQIAQSDLYRTLQQTLREQAQTIAQLQQTLADLSPTASIGAMYLRNDWRPSISSTGHADDCSLRQQLEAQTAHIVALNEQIADARRYATIGEARLNRWRRRSLRG